MTLLQKIVNFFSPAPKPAGSTVKYMFPLLLGFVAVIGASLIGSEDSYIRLESSATTVLQGERFSIDIYASAHVPVNALDLTIDFASDKVEIIAVDKAQSVITIWTQEPTIKDGTITLGGGTFRRGFVGEHLVATIKAEAKFTGQTEFLVRDAQLLAGDGNGTPVAVSGTGSASKTSFYIYDQNEDPGEISARLGININADIDGDGQVTLRDISSFMAAWQSKTKTHDFNSDGKMNFVDFSIILAKSFFN
jgi:hypothetical protein